MNQQGKYQIEFLDTTNAEQIQEYNDFVNIHPNGSFFQCSDWGKVKDNWSNEIVVIRRESGEIYGGALILIKKHSRLPITMLYVPRGPVVDYSDKIALEALLKGIKMVARNYRACMLRLDPFIKKEDTQFISLFKREGFFVNENPDDYSTTQICNNYILELTGKSEEDIFGAFHRKWRYNIRLAERKGVECSVCDSRSLDDFYALLQTTAARDNFEIRTKDYYKHIMNTMGEHCRLYMCHYNGTPISGALSIQFGGKTCYVYGATANEHRNLMPSYLMQWEMIKWAIQTGCTQYDFMGIPYYYDENHPNYGVYRFKKGFNGQVVSYAGDFDYLYSPLLGGLLHRHLSNSLRKQRS